MATPTYLFTNRVYPPVAGATGVLLKELAENLAGGGARVVVVTSRGPRDLNLPKRESINGVKLIRVGSASFSRASLFRRALSYLWLYPQFAWHVWRMGAIDAAISMTDPPMQVAVMALAAHRARRRIHWSQDVYPELAVELGVLRSRGLLAKVLRRVSTWALHLQDEVVVLGRDMRGRLVSRGVNASRIDVIANWSSIEAVAPVEAEAMRARLGWTGKFIALYSGNLGLAHDFDTLVEAVRVLKDGAIQFVFAGEGPQLGSVREAMSPFSHVSFLPPQPRSDLGSFLAAADAHLVTVRAGLSGLVVPSKIYGILAVGRPVLYVGPEESEVAQLLRSSQAGVAVKNGDAAKLADALLSLAGDATKARAMGDRARHAAKDFTLDKALDKWKEVLR